MKQFYSKKIRPRLCFFFYFLSKLIFAIFSPYYRLVCVNTRSGIESYLCIEAGEKGWESIELKELYLSACEYLPSKNVHRLVIQKNKNYLDQVEYAIKSLPITHYLYDPRTGNSDLFYWRGILQSFRIGLLLHKYDVIPIVLLTDISIRTWRTQAAIISSKAGIVISFVSAKCIGSIFPHRRLLGPCLMPFSIHTLGVIDRIIETNIQNKNKCNIVFIGSLYEPRTTVLNNIQSGLKQFGLILDIKGRVLGSPRVPDHDYWTQLCTPSIIVTTSCQMIQKGTDWDHIPHLIYKYLEILACGTLCIAQKVPGIERYFIPGVHFVEYESADEAVQLIAYYTKHEDQRMKIAKQGRERATSLIETRFFWAATDLALSSRSLL